MSHYRTDTATYTRARQGLSVWASVVLLGLLALMTATAAAAMFLLFNPQAADHRPTLLQGTVEAVHVARLAACGK